MADVVGDGEGFLVHRSGDRVGVGRDAHVAEGTGLLDQQDGAKVEERTELTDQHALTNRLVTDRPNEQHIGALLEPRERERTLLVRESPTHERAVAFRLKLQREKREGGFGLRILHFARQRDAGGWALAQRRLHARDRQQHQRKP